jgi:hypothetical protein
MKNAFDWKGQPSIFTTKAKGNLAFGEDATRRNLALSTRSKRAPAMFEGSSKYLGPDLMLARNPMKKST